MALSLRGPRSGLSTVNDCIRKGMEGERREAGRERASRREERTEAWRGERRNEGRTGGIILRSAHGNMPNNVGDERVTAACLQEEPWSSFQANAKSKHMSQGWYGPGESSLSSYRCAFSNLVLK